VKRCVECIDRCFQALTRVKCEGGSSQEVSVFSFPCPGATSLRVTPDTFTVQLSEKSAQGLP